MEFALPWPTTSGEFLAWVSAVLTTLIGLAYLFAPRTMLRASGLLAPADKPSALAHVRGPIAGFLIGSGLGALLLAQPLVYMVLGFCWGFAAFGRLIGMLSDGGGVRNLAHFVAEAALAALPLLFAFGLVA